MVAVLHFVGCQFVVVGFLLWDDPLSISKSCYWRNVRRVFDNFTLIVKCNMLMMRAGARVSWLDKV